MNIEIVEAYKIKDNHPKRFAYSVHVYLVDFGMDFRGIYVKRHKDKFYVSLPSLSTTGINDSKPTRFNILDFSDQSKKQDLIDTLKQKILEYLEKNEPKEISLKNKTPKKNFKPNEKKYNNKFKPMRRLHAPK
jgi:hypothetical protein